MPTVEIDSRSSNINYHYPLPTTHYPLPTMKSNTKQVRDLIKEHILECVYDLDSNQFSTYQGAAKHLYSEFDRVANYGLNLQRFPNNQKRFMDYMQGLPFNFLYYSDDISKFIDTLDINPPKKTPNIQATEELYYYLIFAEMMKAIAP